MSFLLLLNLLDVVGIIFPQIPNACVDVLRYLSLVELLHALSDCSLKRLISVKVVQHILQKSWAELRLDVSPKPLDRLVVLWLVREIPYNLDVKLLVLLFGIDALMSLHIVLEDNHCLFAVPLLLALFEELYV